jgi:hypothetical protein
VSLGAPLVDDHCTDGRGGGQGYEAGVGYVRNVSSTRGKNSDSDESRKVRIIWTRPITPTLNRLNVAVFTNV